MKPFRHPLLLLFFLFLLLPAPSARALDADAQRNFERIAALSMEALTAEARESLEAKYPSEDWESYRFPKYVFTSESVETGYMIAVKEPGILSGVEAPGQQSPIPCYCFCDAMGHKDLLHCFLKKGKPGGKFDDHAAGCNICYGQAMLAFLWSELGATRQEILTGMEQRFGHLRQKVNP